MSLAREATSQAMRKLWQDPEFRAAAVANMYRLTWTDDMLATLKSMRAKGVGLNKCADAIGVHKDTVRRKCKELGL